MNLKLFFTKSLFSLDKYRSFVKDILALRTMKCMNCVSIENAHRLYKDFPSGDFPLAFFRIKSIGLFVPIFETLLS